MANQPSVQAEYVFRGVEHGVRISMDETLLEVEVEDKHTSDQWRGEFDAGFIEDLTHKTGNFKQFSIFCSMLESALMQSSESVTLDLLTYADLEQLRNRKMGSGIWHAPTTKSAALNSKRYLILIYSVEFDRIHYPLPLPYVGKPDPVTLQKVIRELKDELSLLKSKQSKDYRDIEIHRLRTEVERLAEEKQEMEMTMLQLQEDAKLSHKSGALKEVRMLKKIVQSLEAELMKERSKYQRTTNQRMQEYQQLAEELEELKASERTLRVRVKSLTNELALYKRRRLTPIGPSPQNHSGSAHGASRALRSQNSSAAGDEQQATSRERSGSRERSASWSATREHLVDREGQSGSRSRAAHLTPSPSGNRLSRFDPTAYVKDKERKQKEAEMRNIRRIRRDISSSPASDRGRLPSRGSRRYTRRNLQGGSSSVESFRSRQSSVSSLSDLEGFHEPLPASGDKQRMKRRCKPLVWNGFNVKTREKPANRKHLVSTPTGGKSADKENLFDPSTDLSEIDARLHALQEYMKNLDTRT
ncbi:centrosomal protein CCDC61 isoform X2 [Microcaecilia unicolor]|uniref:Centrosomal protein CCDC61 n=1 Tax=Microcaecilia unicolor TaxID=1415580 RepID=A0A6P7ZEV9_9AMPH|nr:coiled-coil domain-containing protein 61 isoform X2 [Microcaecilia unicolor]